MANMIEMPVVDWGAPKNSRAHRIMTAFEEQQPIDLDGKLVIVTDVRWPKGSSQIEYRTRPA